ncbi:MAG: NAD(P)H-hydrate dehydratase [Phycisphaerales bacterium]|nr:NAD(P)H-hydrate dehydratase [Phycisphaerales bacterium]
MTIELPRRPGDGHKGTFGTVLVVGGCNDSDSMMLGGPAFAALGALRSGAGRCVLATPAGVLAESLRVAPSATGLPLQDDSRAADRLHEAAGDVDAEVLGPGLGRSASAVDVVRSRLEADGPPLVLDADGLNVLAEHVDMTIGTRIRVLTPHPGEYMRLACAYGLPDAGGDDASRTLAAGALARQTGSVAVLKGSRTIVSDGVRHWICEVGSVVLATAGTGDVLAGIIGGLLAQPSKNDAFANAVLGTWLHAVAGDLWASRNGDRGLLAAELASTVPEVIHACTTGHRELPDVPS